jgi:alpha-glucosidase
MLVAMVCSLRGSVCLYQGEELGLPEADVPFEALQDPYGITFWPNFKGRDGCRTPMPWTGAADAGFSTGKPWLPVADAHCALSVAAQDADPDSVLNAFRSFMAWRKAQPALVGGSIAFLDTAEPALAFVRDGGGQKVLAAFNLSAAAAQFALPAGDWQAVHGHGLPAVAVGDGVAQLPAYGVLFAQAG